MFITMGSWKNHVRAGLQQRDLKEKLPFAGVFTSLSHLEERFKIRKQIVDDVQSSSSEPGGTEVGKTTRFLQLQLRESEHLAEKLSQTVSDLTTVLHLKEAELQHWQSRVSQYRQEALTLAKGSNALKAALSEFEFTVKCQSKELAAFRVEQKGLKETLAQACIEKERLLQRWMEEKREEAERLNKYNDMQERWQHLADQLKKHFQRRMKRECSPIVTRCSSDATENSPSAIKEFQIHISMTIWDQISGAGLGLKKCLDDRNQYMSHFCLCHVGASSRREGTGGNVSAYQADFTGKATVNVPTGARRFPRNHFRKSAEAALAQAEEQFMWFGQADSDPSETLKVRTRSNCSAPSTPQDAPTVVERTWHR